MTDCGFIEKTESTPPKESESVVAAAHSGPSNASAEMASGKLGHRPGKRGRKPAKIDMKGKLERSRQSARECRARKKLRYQYLEELVSSREKAIKTLRSELEMYKKHCKEVDDGKLPKEVKDMLEGRRKNSHKSSSSVSSMPEEENQPGESKE